MAAEAEILKHAAILDVDELLGEADNAFEALDILLKDDVWFFGAKNPGLFDAGVFAYTHLILDRGLGWRDERLMEVLMSREGLVRHRERIVSGYFERHDGKSSRI